MKTTKKLLGLLLCVVMVLELMPTVSFAAEGDTCNCKGVYCTAQNYNSECPVCSKSEGYKNCEGTSIKINGTALENGTTYEYGEGTVKYDADTDTLTLNNATIEQSGLDTAVRIEGGMLKIVLQGTNKIIANQTDARGAVYSEYTNVTIQGSQEDTLEIQSKGTGIWVLRDNLTVDGAKVTIKCGSQGYSQGLMCNYGQLSIKNKADITIESDYIAIGGDYGVSITDSTVNATSTGTEVNAINCESYDKASILSINNSTVNATCTSDTAFPTIYTYGGIKVENDSTLTAESRGHRGIAVDGYMGVSGNSNVTATSATNEGIKTSDCFNVENSTVKATGGNKLSGIHTLGEFNILGASDVMAVGGLTVGYNDEPNDIRRGTATITPPEGGLLEVKVGTKTDGSDAYHFDKASVVSPYSEAITLTDEELEWDYQYFHCKTHTHAGGTADCTNKAKCTDCTKEYGEPLGHDWKAPTYNWAEDGSSCSATHICSRNSDHNETVIGTVRSQQTKAATCTEKGQTTYTAVFTENWADKQTKVIEDIPATGHNFADGKCTVCGAVAPDFDGGQNQGNTNSPQTGDNSSMALWIALMFLSLAGVGGTVWYSRKKKAVK